MFERLIEWYGNSAVRLTRARGWRAIIGYAMTIAALIPMLLMVAWVVFVRDPYGKKKS